MKRDWGNVGRSIPSLSALLGFDAGIYHSLQKPICPGNGSIGFWVDQLINIDSGGMLTIKSSPET
jgi:hypothetical protein